MLSATLGKEIVIRTPNQIGVLAEISKAVAEKGIDIRAVGAWTEGRNGVIHIVTDDNLRAREALEKMNFDPKEMKVIVAEVPHKPGMLKHMAGQLLEAGIDVHHIYASAAGNSDGCFVVLSTADNDRALVAISKPPLRAVAV